MVRMRAMIGRKGKGFARDDGRETFSAHAKPGKALGKARHAAEGENKRAAREAAT
jgi:hypothetical protein